MTQLQYNLTTGNAYNGRNQAILLAVKEDRNYTSNAWITYIQARDIAQKRLVNAKGKGVCLRTFARRKVKNDKTGKLETETYPKAFIVFNCDHLEGHVEAKPEVSKIIKSEAYIDIDTAPKQDLF